MRTRIRFTANGKPLTYTVFGRSHTMDWVTSADEATRTAAVDRRRKLLVQMSGTPYDAITVHLDPLPAPKADPLALALEG